MTQHNSGRGQGSQNAHLVECAPGVSPDLVREHTAAPFTEALSTEAGA